MALGKARNMGFGNLENSNNGMSQTSKFISGLLGRTPKKNINATSTVPSDDDKDFSDSESSHSNATYSSRTHIEHKTNTSNNSASLLSKKASLISTFTETPDGDFDDFYAPTSKSGVLVKQANHLKNWKKRFMVLRGQSLFYYVSGMVCSLCAFRDLSSPIYNVIMFIVQNILISHSPLPFLTLCSLAKSHILVVSLLSQYVLALVH